MNFGEKLRELRTQHKWTQSELSKKIGVSLRTVVSYESGKSYPKQREIYKKIATLFGVDVNYLLTEGVEEARFSALSREEFVEAASEKYGSRGKLQAEDLVQQASGMFAGGELSEEDKDAVMQALQQAYWDAKQKNQRKA